MILYATISAQRGGREAKKGDDQSLEIELSAFGKVIGKIYLDVMTDANEKDNQYLLQYHKTGNVDPDIIEEGHKKTGLIQYQL